MRHHKIITIKVWYDETTEAPDNNMLKRSIENYVGAGMLNPDDYADTVLDTYTVDVTDIIRDKKEE